MEMIAASQFLYYVRFRNDTTCVLLVALSWSWSMRASASDHDRQSVCRLLWWRSSHVHLGLPVAVVEIPLDLMKSQMACAATRIFHAGSRKLWDSCSSQTAWLGEIHLCINQWKDLCIFQCWQNLIDCQQWEIIALNCNFVDGRGATSYIAYVDVAPHAFSCVFRCGTHQCAVMPSRSVVLTHPTV